MSAEGLRSQIAALEKKQKKFDSQLSEQQSLAEKNAQERDQAEVRARQAETKALSLTRELDGYQDKLEEVERLRKQLQVSTCIYRTTFTGNISCIVCCCVVQFNLVNGNPRGPAYISV